jgi:hypothetical protein
MVRAAPRRSRHAGSAACACGRQNIAERRRVAAAIAKGHVALRADLKEFAAALDAMSKAEEDGQPWASKARRRDVRLRKNDEHWRRVLPAAAASLSRRRRRGLPHRPRLRSWRAARGAPGRLLAAGSRLRARRLPRARSASGR